MIEEKLKQEMVDYLLLKQEITDLKEEQKKIEHLLSTNVSKEKQQRKKFIQGKQFFINKAKYIKHLEKIHPQIRYISGYKMRKHKEKSSFKVLVQDRKTKIRFYVLSNRLRQHDWQCNEIGALNKANIFTEDLQKWVLLRKKYKYDKRKQIRPITFRQCHLCGRTFESKRGALLCSNECRRKWSNRMREKKRSIRTKRAKANGKYDNSITLEKLFKRDNGICYICGKHLNLSTYYNSPDAPTIKHVIPIIKGGTHTWNNVKLACRACNSIKGTKISKEYIERAS
ncbi:HNH endonuclease [Lactobacillus crispatus]|uniref:HNH endonuclease n=1 Tax=Lactobacillus crispatus TaxID=47770 RepID=UPI00254DDF5C|nr:HNH endonuclease [Lactobacillus crispatus]MDK7933703.1 HNH endonuclease [Lactobacillus crispatus]